MRKFKKLLAGVCAAAMCLTAIVMPVSAESKDYYSEPNSYEYVLSSYTQPYPHDGIVDYDSKAFEGLLDQCRVKNPSSLYMDTAIRKEAENAIANNKLVYDLRYLADHGITYLSVNDKKKIFNYGIYIHEGFSANVIVKCSKKDYEEVFEYKNGRKMKENEYEFRYDDDDHYEKYSYNPTSKILRVKIQMYIVSKEFTDLFIDISDDTIDDTRDYIIDDTTDDIIDDTRDYLIDDTTDDIIDETPDYTINDTTDQAIYETTNNTTDDIPEGTYVSTMYINGKYADSARAIREQYSSCITYADLAFFQARQTSSGEFVMSKEPSDLEDTVRILHEARVDAIASFGGSYGDDGPYGDDDYKEYLRIFKNGSHENLHNFAKFLAKSTKDRGMDGIDLDIEVYTEDGDRGEQYVWDNYSYFVKELKNECDSRNLILTTALDKYCLELHGQPKISTDALNCFKYINVMSYKSLEDANTKVHYLMDLVESRRQIVVGQCFYIKDDRLQYYSNDTLKERCRYIIDNFDGRLGGIMFWDFYRDVMRDDGKKLTGFIDDYLDIYKTR